MCLCETWVSLQICYGCLITPPPNTHTRTHKHTQFLSSPPPVWTGWATVGRRNVYIYRKADWLKWLNDWLCGKTLYLTHHDVNTRLDRCHGFSLTWLRRALLISNIQGQMLRHSDGLSHTYTHLTRDMASNIRSYWKSHNDNLLMHFCSEHVRTW